MSARLTELPLGYTDLGDGRAVRSERLVPRFPADFVPPPAAPAPPKAGKYKNVRTPGPAPWGGTMDYDSRAEAETAGELALMKRAGTIRGWLPQVSLPIGAGPRGLRRHKVDFIVVENDGRCRLLERKGHDHADGEQRRNDLEALGVPVEVSR